jgi:DNA-binding NarL/FixJ family response regulator
MPKHKHLMISPDGEILPRWQEVFASSQTIAYGEVQATDADIIWLRLNGFVPATPQIDWLQAHYPACNFVVLSTIPTASEAMLSLTAGARAYANVHAGVNNLQQIAEIVYEGGIWVGEDLMQLLVSTLSRVQAAESQIKPNLWRDLVSKREAEVVTAVAAGASNKLVAKQLDISERTVKAHLSAAFEKLEVKDRLKLVLLVSAGN